MQKIKRTGIYCIENIVNNKKYIGQSINIDDRWLKHRNELNSKRHYNDYLQKAWDKYGESSFKFYILEECANDELDEKEIYYIEKYNTLNRDYGYNLKEGGQNGVVCEYGIEKQRKALIEAYKNPILREQRRKSALKQWSNPEIKAKIIGENNGMYGKTHTEEARKKISEAQKGHISKYRNLTPVLCVELNKTFSCAADACKEFGKNLSILEVCKGNRKTAGGYHWKFITENNI